MAKPRVSLSSTFYVVQAKEMLRQRSPRISNDEKVIL